MVSALQTFQPKFCALLTLLDLIIPIIFGEENTL
jgi:hypothetical protein